MPWRMAYTQMMNVNASTGSQAMCSPNHLSGCEMYWSRPRDLRCCSTSQAVATTAELHSHTKGSHHLMCASEMLSWTATAIIRSQKSVQRAYKARELPE